LLPANSTQRSSWLFLRYRAKDAQRSRGLSLLLVLPAALYMLLVVFYPLLLLVKIGFTNQRIGLTGQWVGIDNFSQLLLGSDGQTAILNTLRYASLSTISALTLGLIVALLLNKINVRHRFLEVLIVLPWAIPPTITALVWLWMFYDIGGVLNWMLMQFGFISVPISWLGQSRLAQISVLAPNIWRLTPFFAVSLLSSRASFESALYEAAALDGAGPVQQFAFVTLPSLYRTILVTSAFAFLWSATEFPLIYVLTRGGPASSTHLLGTLSYDLALRGGAELGLGAACALLVIPLSTALAFAVWRLGSWRER
jgi:multiple sugar transport system permease protein